MAKQRTLNVDHAIQEIREGVTITIGETDFRRVVLTTKARLEFQKAVDEMNRRNWMTEKAKAEQKAANVVTTDLEELAKLNAAVVDAEREQAAANVAFLRVQLVDEAGKHPAIATLADLPPQVTGRIFELLGEDDADEQAADEAGPTETA